MTKAQLPWVPTDGGPIYKETLTPDEFLIIEPWNAISSIAIILPAIYWSFKLLKFPFKDYLFMWYCIPLLILGGSGSTLFHAFRSSNLLLYLDVLPTAILTLSIGVLFWVRYTNNWFLTVFIFVSSYIFRFYSYEWLSGHMATNIAYFITGILIFLPILLYLNRIGWIGLKWMIFSVLFLFISLVFREIDKRELIELPMGTHFLWHLFSGVGAWFLAKFLYTLRLIELEKKSLLI